MGFLWDAGGREELPEGEAVSLSASTGRCTVMAIGLSNDACFRGGLHKGLISSVSGSDSGRGAPRRQRESQVIVDGHCFYQVFLLLGDPSLPCSCHVLWVELCPFPDSRVGHVTIPRLQEDIIALVTVISSGEGACMCAHTLGRGGKHIIQAWPIRGNFGTSARALRDIFFFFLNRGKQVGGWHGMQENFFVATWREPA